MSDEKPVDAIVLDTGPILQNSPSVSTLLSKSKKIFTSPSIVAEIKDINARTRFETTLGPFTTIKTPSPINIKFVTEFARKTGDLAVLSKADVEILSLAYEIDHEKKQEEVQLNDDLTNAGSDTPSKPHQVFPTQDVTPDANVSKSTPAAPWAPSQGLSSKDKDSSPNLFDRDVDKLSGKGDSQAPTDELQRSLDSDSISIPNEEENLHSASHIKDSSAARNPAPEPMPEQKDYDSEDSEGWITPANIKRVQAAESDKSSSTSIVKEPIRTAIITTDFAMQNVILQMGLNLLSPSMSRINNIRTYVLRCHACFQTVKDISRQFCPRCGKPTLTRVSCSTNAKGEFKIHLKKKMQWNHRGDRYSIPKPVPGQANGKIGKGKGGGKGGWGQELILAEDQKEYQRAVGSNGRSKGIDLMDEDYLPGILTGDRGRPGGRPKVGAGRNVNSKKRI